MIEDERLWAVVTVFVLEILFDLRAKGLREPTPKSYDTCVMFSFICQLDTTWNHFGRESL